jgi:drug/metabolite transporter (DMT)-like permease
MKWIVFILIPTALVAFVTGQLFLKRAMESSREKGFRDARVISFLAYGVLSMSVNFFLTLGLLAHLDLSFVYPFQGLSVIIISLAAAIVLREKLNLRLTIGALLISAGVVLVSMS